MDIFCCFLFAFFWEDVLSISSARWISVGRVVGGLLVWVAVFCHDFICVGVWNCRCMEYGDVF